MAELEYAIRYELLSDTDTAAIVVARIYPAPAPQNTTLPFVTYQRISAPRTYSMGGDRGLADVRLQINCYANSQVAVKALAAAVRGALSGIQGTKGHASYGGTVNIRTCHLESESDGFDLTPGTEKGTRSIQQDWMIWHFE